MPAHLAPLDPSTSTPSQVYERYQAETHARSTRDDARRAIRLFEQFAPGLPIVAITSDVLRLWRQSLASHVTVHGRPLSTETVNKRLRYLHALCALVGPKSGRYPAAMGWTDTVPTIAAIRTRETVVEAMTDEEAGRCYHAAATMAHPTAARTGTPPGLWWQTLIVYLLNVGSRVSEWSSLRWQQIDFEAATLTTEESKTGKRRRVPLCSTVVDHLAAIRPVDVDPMRPVFGKVSYNYAKRLFDELQRSAGIVVDRPAGSTRRNVYGFHELRSACATRLWAINPGHAQAMLGHASIETTRRHYVKADPQLAAAVASLDQPAAFSSSEPPHPTPPPPTEPVTLQFRRSG